MKKVTVRFALVMATCLPSLVYAEAAKSNATTAGSDAVKGVVADKAVVPVAENKPGTAKPTTTGTGELKRAPDSDTVAVSGKIVETFNAGSYTYFLIEKDGKKTWVAVPPTEGKVGEEISFRPGMQMGEFKSARLNRTFDNIIFSVGKVGSEGTKQGEEFLMKKSHELKAAAPTSQGDPIETNAGSSDVISGKVVEAMEAGGYSYFALEKEGKKTWVAVTKCAGKVGDVMTFKQGSEMKNFKSKALDRTFESIIFSDGVASPGVATQGSSESSAKSAKAVVGKVEKASVANGYTVAELYEKSTMLNGKEVVVAGRVVKVSKQIMGKNWIHLQDGSGDAATGTNNLATTTQDLAVVGDLVIATGKLAKDKDFGGGYQYGIIIEETTLVKK